MDIQWPDVGKRVCVAGRGTAATVHNHPVIVRKTKTMVVTEREMPDGRRVQRRFRYDGREVGASAYGGTYASSTCQRPRKT